MKVNVPAAAPPVVEEQEVPPTEEPVAPPAAPAPAQPAPAPAPAQPAATLPGGRTRVFEGNRFLVAHYGTAGTGALGVLGERSPDRAAAAVRRAGRPFRRPGRPVQAVFELIVTVVDARPGRDGDYSHDIKRADVRRYIRAAHAHGVLLLLDLQTGRSDFLTVAKRWEWALRDPYVGLALDPEWRLTKKQKHLVQIGSVTAAEINRTSQWLADLTREKALPQKIFVLHQFSLSMIKHRSQVDTSRPELATVIHVDGSGPQGAKKGTWRTLRRDAPPGVGWGWKNFVDEDDPMLNAQQTWRRVTPHPDLVTYQ